MAGCIAADSNEGSLGESNIILIICSQGTDTYVIPQCSEGGSLIRVVLDAATSVNSSNNCPHVSGVVMFSFGRGETATCALPTLFGPKTFMFRLSDLSSTYL